MTSTRRLKLTQSKPFQFPGRSPQAAQLQQAGVRDPERVLLLAPVQPLPQRGGQGGAGAQVRHHGLAGHTHVLLHTYLAVAILILRWLLVKLKKSLKYSETTITFQ